MSRMIAKDAQASAMTRLEHRLGGAVVDPTRIFDDYLRQSKMY